jgi:hypothetical protein
VIDVKITDPDGIRSSEKELIDNITGDLDWSVIEKVFKKEHNLSLEDDVEYRQGDIVVHNNNIAYKLEFDVKVKLSVIFDRNGDYLDFSTPANQNNPSDESQNSDMSGSDAENTPAEDSVDNCDTKNSPAIGAEFEPNENVSRMAAQIADMISDINED